MLAAVSVADVCRTSVPEGVRDEELRRRRYVTKGVGRRGGHCGGHGTRRRGVHVRWGLRAKGGLCSQPCAWYRGKCPVCGTP